MAIPRILRPALLSLGFLSCVSAPDAEAKRVVCIDESGDAAVHMAEGFHLADPEAGDVLVVGGLLEDCLANAADGDDVVLETHGGPSVFTWGNVTYAGFGPTGGGGGTSIGGGLEPFEVPAGFASNVSFELRSCFGAVAAETSSATAVTDSLAAAYPTLGSVTADDAAAPIAMQIALVGGTGEEQNAASLCLLTAAYDAGFFAEPAVTSWAASMRPGPAAVALGDAVALGFCPLANDQVSVVVTYDPATEPVPPSIIEADSLASLSALFCDHGCATSGDLKLPLKRLKFMTKCNDLVIKKGASASLAGPCRNLLVGEPPELCAAPHVSWIVRTAFGENDLAEDPLFLGFIADKSISDEIKCARSVAKEVTKAYGKLMKGCPKQLSSTLKFGKKIGKACAGLLPVRDPVSNYLFPSVGGDACSGHVLEGVAVDATALSACLLAEVEGRAAKTCPQSWLSF